MAVGEQATLTINGSSSANTPAIINFAQVTASDLPDPDSTVNNGSAPDPVEDDAFWRPYERSDGVEDAMHQYLSWEQGLVEQIGRDGTAPFKVLEP